MSPRFSVIIPALDEADRVARAIASARAGLGPATEIIVIDAASRDATAAVASQSGARVLRGPANRGEQLRLGTQAAAGDVLVLLHADTLLPPGSGRAIEAALADPRVAGGAFRLRFENADGATPLRLRMLAAAINLRSRLFRTATGDQAMFARAAALRMAGGVPAVPLFEDVRLYRGLRRAGGVVLLEDSVVTSARRWRSAGTLRVVLLHLMLRALHGAGVPPGRLARWYAATSAR